MTPIGSTNSNIRRAIEFTSYSFRCRPGAPCRHSRPLGRSRAAELIAERRRGGRAADGRSAGQFAMTTARLENSVPQGDRARAMRRRRWTKSDRDALSPAGFVEQVEHRPPRARRIL
jgi:hypothetical protein